MSIKLYLMLLPLIAVIGLASSFSPQSNSNLPKFIQDDIAGYKKENNPKQQPVISEYEWKGKKVYFFRMPCCDQLDPIYDSDGKYLCTPSKGSMGKTRTDNCPEFSDSTKFIRRIWPETK